MKPKLKRTLLVILLASVVSCMLTATVARGEVGEEGVFLWGVDWGGTETELFVLPFKKRIYQGFVLEEAEVRAKFQAAIGGIVSDIYVVRDPSVAYNFDITNTTTQPQPFFSTIDFLINPLAANTSWGELTVELFDDSGDGQVFLTGNFGNAIQGTSVRNSSTLVGESIGVPLGSDITTVGTHTFTLDPISGPTPADGDEISMSTFFILSPGDRAHLTSRFIIDEGTGIPFAEIQPLPDPADGPFFNVIDVPTATIGDNSGIGSQTQLNVSDGGVVGNNFQAGVFGESNFDVEMNVSGGQVGTNLLVASGAVVNISGGSVGNVNANRAGGVVNISGGSVGAANVNAGLINISGGSFTFGVNASDGVMNISGGSFDSGNFGIFGGEINFIGSEFQLDGAGISGLTPGEPFTITDRDVTLSGLLADGSAFSFDLNSTFQGSQDYADPSATLTVTAVPEPSALALGVVGMLLLGALAWWSRRRTIQTD